MTIPDHVFMAILKQSKKYETLDLRRMIKLGISEAEKLINDFLKQLEGMKYLSSKLNNESRNQYLNAEIDDLNMILEALKK
jgi:hypothetical protein